MLAFFVAFPPFQPPPRGSAQLSHCWNLPNAWVPAAQQLCLAVPAFPRAQPQPSAAAASPARRTPQRDPSPAGWASCSLLGLSSTQTQQHPLHSLPLSITAQTGHLEGPASASSSDPHSFQTQDNSLPPRVFHNLSEDAPEQQALCSQGAPLPLQGSEEGLRHHRDGKCGWLKQHKAVHRISLSPPQPAHTILTALRAGE